MRERERERVSEREGAEMKKNRQDMKIKIKE